MGCLSGRLAKFDVEAELKIGTSVPCMGRVC